MLFRSDLREGGYLVRAASCQCLVQLARASGTDARSERVRTLLAVVVDTLTELQEDLDACLDLLAVARGLADS